MRLTRAFYALVLNLGVSPRHFATDAPQFYTSTVRALPADADADLCSV